MERSHQELAKRVLNLFSLKLSLKADGWIGSKDRKPGPGAYNPNFYNKPKFPKWK